MSISRVWQSGMELNSRLREFDGVEYTGTDIISVTNAGYYTGSYALRLYKASTDTKQAAVYKDIAPLSQFRLCLWIYPQILVGATNYPRDTPLISFFAGATRVMTLFLDAYSSPRWYTTVINLNGTEQIYWFNYPTMSSWQHWTLDYKADSSAGWIAWYINSSLVGSFSGNTGTNAITRVYFGSKPTFGTGLIQHYVGTNVFYDDIYIDDTAGEASHAPGPSKRFPYLPSNGNGNYSQWSGSDGNSVDNYGLIDEIPPNDDTDYVVATESGLIDSYNIASAPSVPTLYNEGVIVATIPTVSARDTDATETQIKLGTRLSGTNLTGVAQNLSTSYGVTTFERQSTKPGGGSWEIADISDLEIVIESAGSYS